MAEKTNPSRFFQNRECEHFPCHPGVKEENFNCLFCFCPLYPLGKKCGGNCRYTKSGKKSCHDCSFPHEKEHYEAVMARYDEIAAIVKRSDEEEA